LSGRGVRGAASESWQEIATDLIKAPIAAGHEHRDRIDEDAMQIAEICAGYGPGGDAN